MTKEVLEILQNRKAILKGGITEDKARYGDAFLGQFMRGRVAVEERWLEETERLIEFIEKHGN
jgi:hypothetical protein